MNSAVVLISSHNPGNRGFGTGFVIGEQAGETLLVTCAHVIDEIGGPGQVLADEQEAALVACGGTGNGDIDLAVLRVPTLRQGPVLELQSSARSADPISVDGFQRYGNRLLLRKLHGVLDQEVELAFWGRAERIRAWDLQITGEYGLEPGYSGAPVTGSRGNVIGVVAYRAGQATGLAISVDALGVLWPQMPRGLFDMAPGPITHLVTNREYLGFTQDSGDHRPLGWGPSVPHFADDQADRPVTRISWDDAVAYCDWQGSALPPTGASSMTAPSGIGEWRDGGTEDDKDVRDPATSDLLRTVRRDTRSYDIGFRCVPARHVPQPRWVVLDGGRFQFGVDARRFGGLADRFHLPPALRQQILDRQARTCELPGFKISAACVTNEEYYAFTQTGRAWPCHWAATWLRRWDRPFPPRLASLPVVNVTARDARLYCIWSQVRLPSWLEWERAASSAAVWAYPWGERYDPALCNGLEGRRGSLAAVDEYRGGDNPEGVRQLCGNVAEWVTGTNGNLETRGGSYRVPCELWGLAYVFNPACDDHRAPDVGFRVVTD